MYIIRTSYIFIIYSYSLQVHIMNQFSIQIPNWSQVSIRMTNIDQPLDRLQIDTYGHTSFQHSQNWHFGYLAPRIFSTPEYQHSHNWHRTWISTRCFFLPMMQYRYFTTSSCILYIIIDNTTYIFYKICTYILYVHIQSRYLIRKEK